MTLQAILAIIFGCFLSFPFFLSGQTPPSAAAPATNPSSPGQNYPEQAYLSPTRYTNGFFGFSFELPADAHLKPIAEPVAHDQRIQLLELGGPPPASAEVAIVAFPPHAKEAADAKAMLRKALDEELFRGVEELRGLSKTMLAGHPFYFFETRRGIDQHMLAAANLNGYVVMVELGSRNQKMVKDLESCFQHIVFFAPAEIHRYRTADAEKYEGPTISSRRRAQLESDPPKDHIDAGKIQDGMYRNPALGFTYQVPAGWFVETQGAVLPAIERSRAKDSLAPLIEGSTADANAVESQLMNACSRTLFSVWAKEPAPDGQIPYDEFGEVTLTATETECFPAVKFPSSATDRRAMRDFLLMLSLSHPILRDMRNAEAVEAHGIVFLLVRGTVAFQLPNDELSRRLSVAMAVTEKRGYLLTWFFAAPHDDELEPLLQARAAFDVDPAEGANAATATTPKKAPSSSPGASASLPGGGSTLESPASTNQSGQNGAANSAASAGATPQENSAGTPQPTRPTLLRPGETMESQQGKGPPVKKH